MSYEITVEQSEPKMLRVRAASEPGPQRVRYGLPCAKCYIYYSAELPACPICKFTERVSPFVRFVPAAASL
jgi:hypothetical protein